ncbi:Fibronectin type III [Trinorchestia longiramus]|nr:Fibronectin type III [Trinorchestia longiramus]
MSRKKYSHYFSPTFAAVPPTWVTEPRDASVALGEALVVPCSARGFPQPKVTWLRKTASGEWKDEFRGGRIWRGHGSNATLSLPRAALDHEGSYLCKAANGVGSGLSRIITITVDEPPWFPNPNPRIEVDVGGTAVLRCRVRGDQPLTLRWVRNGATLPAGPRHDLRDEGAGVLEAVLELSVRHVRAADAGVYLCEASNAHGTRTADFQLHVMDVPSAPSDVTVVGGGSRHVVLQWLEPTATSGQTSVVSSYNVSYVTDDGLSNSTRVEGPHARVDGLEPATVYRLSVVAHNRVGSSKSSAAVIHKTLEEKPSGSPRNVKITSTTSTTFRLSWLPPLPNSTHGTLLGYHIGVRDNSFTRREEVTTYSFMPITLSESDEAPAHLSDHPAELLTSHVMEQSRLEVSPANFTVGGVSSSGGIMQATVEGLNPFTRYALVLRAYNTEGTGPLSPPVTSTTAEDKPSSPPLYVSCEFLSSSTLLVSWSPPTRGANGIITSYRVAYKKLMDSQSGVSSPLFTSATLPSSDRVVHSGTSRHAGSDSTTGGLVVVTDGLTARLVALRAYSNYSVSVAAATAVGTGVMSDVIICSTKQDVPTAPTSIKIVQSGPSSAIVSWNLPEEPRGVLTQYTVKWVKDGAPNRLFSKILDPQTTHLVIRDLSTQRVEAWVSAATSVGSGVSSERVSLMPKTEVKAGVWSVGSAQGVAWKQDVRLPCQAVGDPAPTKSWTHDGKQLKFDSRTSVVGDGFLRILDVQRSNGGWYECTATNTYGSDSVRYHLTVLMPPSPPSLHVTETTPSSVRLQWRVSDDGGTPVQEVTLYYRATGWDTKEIRVTEETHTVGGLKCGTLYHFFATARNAIDDSESSQVVQAHTKGRPPEPPPQFQFITTNSTQATLYLTQWEDGGCPITHFRVQYRRLRAPEWTIVSNSVPVMRTYAVGGLEPGQQYELRVSAHNSAGITPAAYSVTTPFLHGAGGVIAPIDGSWDVGSLNDPPVSPGLWDDPRVVVPGVISATALLFTIITLCVCTRRSKPREQEAAVDAKKSLPEIERSTLVKRKPVITTASTDGPSSSSETSSVAYQNHTPTHQIRLLQQAPPNGGRYSKQAIELGAKKNGGVQQKGFMAVVYQAPSLHDVDEANMQNRCGSYETLSQRTTTDGESDYGSVLPPGVMSDRTLPLYQHYRQPRHKAQQQTTSDAQGFDKASMNDRQLYERPQLEQHYQRPQLAKPKGKVPQPIKSIAKQRPQQELPRQV